MSAAFPAGRLRHRLTLLNAVDTLDDNGGVNRAWASGSRVWASIEAVTAGRQFNAEREAQIVTHRILMRRRGDLNGAMRLLEGERLFRILAIEDADAARNYQRVLCEEIKP